MTEGMDFIVRYVPLPLKVHGMTVQDVNGFYNIYINSAQSEDVQRAAYKHELEHLKRGDFARSECPLELVENI